MSTETKNPPVKKFNIGLVQCSIWKNEKDGKTYYNAKIDPRYKAGADYKTSTSHGTDDLIKIAKVALQAHSEILMLQAADKKAAGEQTDEDHREEEIAF